MTGGTALTPDLSKIRVPMLECTSFSDANLHSVGSMRAFQQTGSIERHAYAHRGPKWATFYGEAARQVQLAFFDRHLRERDVPPLPPMRLEIRDRADHVVEVRDEQEWPLARTDWRQLYLAADGALSEHPSTTTARSPSTCDATPPPSTTDSTTTPNSAAR